MVVGTVLVIFAIGLSACYAVSTPTIDTSEISTQKKAIQLTDTAATDRMPVVVVRGTTVHLAWESGDEDVLYKKSTDGGETFGDTITVGDGNFSWLSTQPVVMDVVSDNVYIAWNSASSKTKFARSTDGGDSFGTPATISNGGRPSLSAYGSNVDLIGWGGSGDDVVKFARSTDYGANFGSISDAGAGGIVNAIDSSSNEIYIVARVGADSMRLHKSTDGGSNFATSTIGTGNNFPTIQKTDVYLHVTYTNPATNVTHLISDDLGATWSSTMTFSSEFAPTAPVYTNGTLHNIAWRHDDMAGGEGQIHFATSTDGVTYDKLYQVSGLGRNYNGQEPALGVNNTLVAIAFTGCTNNLASNQCDIFFTKSSDAGQNFSPIGGSDEVEHVIATESAQTFYNTTGVETNIIDVYNTTPSSNDFTVITPNLNATFTASTTPDDLSHSAITILNSTRTINTTANPDATIVGTIQELGYTNSTKISFDKMVKLTFNGETGNTPFFINATNTYTIDQCDGSPKTSSEAASDATITAGNRECYWTATNSTKFVWTYHFTAFGTGNNFGSSTETTTTSGGGNQSCNSRGFGVGKSLAVYEVSYNFCGDNRTVDILAYSTCGAIRAELTTEYGRSSAGLSLEQPFIDDEITVYTSVLRDDVKSFTVKMENKRNDFEDKFIINECKATKKYSQITGYTSSQQGTFGNEGFTVSVPTWVKNTAGWWSEDKISEDEFVRGIEFLIKERIIDNVKTGSVKSTSSSVPTWVKNTAGWWSEDKISEGEFVKGIEYLVKTGIIQVS